MSKINSFKSGVEATRKSIEIVEAAKVAKEIKQYGGIDVYNLMKSGQMYAYRDWETDRKSTRLNSSHSAKSRMPSSA